MSAEIRNCEFRFKCSKRWDALQLTADDGVRYCGQCQRTVHYCKTPSELQTAIVNDLCVAVEICETKESEPMLIVGNIVHPPYSNSNCNVEP